MRRRVPIYTLIITVCFMVNIFIYADSGNLPLKEDISTSVVLTKENLYVVNSKNELLVCGVANKYADNNNCADRNANLLQTSLKKVMDNVVSVSASYNSSHVFVIKSDGSLWGWGFNNMNPYRTTCMLGLGEDIKYTDVPVKIMDNIVSVSTGDSFTLALKKDGSLWKWGDPYYGASLAPEKIMDNAIFAAIGGPLSHDSLVIKEDNSLWVEGSYNVFPFNLSDGVTLSAYKPEGLTRVMENVKYAAALYDANYAVKLDGSLWSWGMDDTGQLGNGGKYDQGPGGTSWSSGSDDTERVYKLYSYQRNPLKIFDNTELVVPTVNGVYAYTTNGELWMWGDSSPAKAYRRENKFEIIKTLEPGKIVPRKISHDFCYISVWGESSAIVKKDGSIWVKGENEYGQLGTGNTVNVSDYKQIMYGGVAGQKGFKVLKAEPTASGMLVDGQR